VTQIIVTVPGVTFDNMLFGDGWQLGELEGWWDTTKPRVGSDPRPEWHGDFGQDNVYLEPRFITVSGVFQSRENPDLVMSARDAIAALHEAGEFDFTVSDGVVGRVTARLASELLWDVDYAPGCAWFEFTVKADDPRKYGQKQTLSTGAPTAGVGIADPLLDPIQEGAAGNLGRVELVNAGTAPSEPMVRVSGGLSEGFELLCIETGSVVRVTRPIPDGSVIDIDMGAGQVWIDQQSPLSAMYVPVAEWFSVKPGATCTIQFTPLGVVTGTPMVTVEFAEASW
jgi:hypothetical protein